MRFVVVAMGQRMDRQCGQRRSGGTWRSASGGRERLNGIADGRGGCCVVHLRPQIGCEGVTVCSRRDRIVSSGGGVQVGRSGIDGSR